VAIGRPRNQPLAEAISDYETRAGRYWPLEVREVREGKGADATAVRRDEGGRITETIGRQPFVACDERGRSFDSRAFADWMREARDSGRDVTFVIGGAFGLDETVAAAAQLQLSLAPWTLPHELARLVLAEQLYRAGTILRGEPYHK
jgi:23S rRNA (pseudouridine1915-N3)-methyltransferase